MSPGAGDPKKLVHLPDAKIGLTGDSCVVTTRHSTMCGLPLLALDWTKNITKVTCEACLAESISRILQKDG